MGCPFFFSKFNPKDGLKISCWTFYHVHDTRKNTIYVFDFYMAVCLKRNFYHCLSYKGIFPSFSTMILCFMKPFLLHKRKVKITRHCLSSKVFDVFITRERLKLKKPRHWKVRHYCLHFY